jgi:hypothetical protein
MLPFPEGLAPAFLTVVAANHLTAEGRWRSLAISQTHPRSSTMYPGLTLNLSACLASP